jgi:tRNA-Thr(GGU) m(6)t(6)A37 methyltransferase TsaA
MATVGVRYIVDDVDAALAFYTGHLGFVEVMHPAPAFAMLSRGDLRLALSAPNPQGGGGQTLADGRVPAPGGWNRVQLEVADVHALAQQLRDAGATLRSDVVTGMGGDQVIVDDPSGNPVELFQPKNAEAQLTQQDTYEVAVLGHVRSPLTDPADAPRQGDEGAPDAVLELDPTYAPALAGLAPGDDVVVLTWLHLGDRETLAVHPRGDTTRPVAGVFATRSSDRPNPLGLHRCGVLAVDGTRLTVSGLEAVDGTPVVDVKIALGDIADR